MIAAGNPALVPVIFGVCLFVVWPILVWVLWVR